jgi:hypothetical protein
MPSAVVSESVQPANPLTTHDGEHPSFAIPRPAPSGDRSLRAIPRAEGDVYLAEGNVYLAEGDVYLAEGNVYHAEPECKDVLVGSNKREAVLKRASQVGGRICRFPAGGAGHFPAGGSGSFPGRGSRHFPTGGAGIFRQGEQVIFRQGERAFPGRGCWVADYGRAGDGRAAADGCSFMFNWPLPNKILPLQY